jgi:uncharacterized phage-like protein YoqJ
MNGSVCSFTGYSPNHFSFGFDEENNKCVELKFRMHNEISTLIDNGITEFQSGMALGVDIWSAEIVLGLRDRGKPVKLKCVLPCESQADKWSVGDRERYFTILEKADDEHYISWHYTETCMRERNTYLVDHANVVAAVYDGKPQGSTAQIVCYAHKQGKSILIIDPDTCRVTPYMMVMPGKKQRIELEI